jgi:outer membrane lipoprotein-sorting protein
MNILRRLPVYRLVLLTVLVVLVGVSATAIAFALGSGSKPPQRPLAQAIHDALAAPSVEGVSATVKLTNNLLEGASLASGSGQGSEAASSPLLTGASGRLWIAKDGRARLELQSQKGDTQVVYDGSTVTIYDASTNTVYRYKPPASETTSPPSTPESHEAPSVAKIEEAITHIAKNATLSGATPDNVAGAPAYTVRISPKQGGSLLGGAELSFDAANGAPLRAAIYSTTSSSPVIELAATEVSFGAVADSVFTFTPPANAKVEEIAPSADTSHSSDKATSGDATGKPTITTHGDGPAAIAVLTSKLPAGKQGSSAALEGLPKVTINGTKASELRTALGTLLTFERSGVRYVLAGSDTPAAIEALARGL